MKRRVLSIQPEQYHDFGKIRVNSSEHMLEVLRKYGLDLDELPEKNISCPHPAHVDNKPSFSVFISDDGTPLAHGFVSGCPFWGEEKEEWHNAQQLDFYHEHQRFPRKAELKKSTTNEEHLAEHDKLGRLLISLASEEPSPLAKQYLEDIGLGQLPKKHLELTPRLHVEMVRALISEGNKPNEVEKLLEEHGFYSTSKRLAYPHYSYHLGEWVFAKFNCRFIDTYGMITDREQPKFLTLGGTKELAGHLYLPSWECWDAEKIIICGGEKDADVLWHFGGLPACTVGSESYSLSRIRHLFRGIETHFLYDDEVGSKTNARRQSADFATYLKQDVYLHDWKPWAGKDVSDCWWEILRENDGKLEGARKDFRRYMVNEVLKKQIEMISPDSKLAIKNKVFYMLDGGKTSRFAKEHVGDLLYNALEKRGRFLVGEDGQPRYFDSEKHRMWSLPKDDTKALERLLNEYGLNPSDDTATFVYNHIRLKALDAYEDKPAKISQVYAYKDGYLYRDNGDGTMWAVQEGTGERRLLQNGDEGVVFDDCGCSPLEDIEPDYRALRRFEGLARFKDTGTITRKDQRQIIRAINYALVLARALGIRPPCLNAIGVWGSGKSTLTRSFGRLHNGDRWQVSQLPQTADDLLVVLANEWYYVADNVDVDNKKWLKDVVAALVTGTAYKKRALYSSLGVAEVMPNPYLAVTSMNGSLLKRPDLADRSITLVLDEIPSAMKKPEKELWDWLSQNRSGILWAVIEGAMKALPEAMKHESSKLRMNDWWRLASGLMIAMFGEEIHWVNDSWNGAYSKEDEEFLEGGSSRIFQWDKAAWEQLADRMETHNALYATKNIYGLWELREFIINGEHYDGKDFIAFKAQELLQRIAPVDGIKTGKDGKLTAQGFGDSLTNNATHLKKLFGMEIVYDPHTKSNTYRFTGGMYWSKPAPTPSINPANPATLAEGQEQEEVDDCLGQQVIESCSQGDEQ